MKKYFILLICIIFTGCSGFSSNPPINNLDSSKEVNSDNSSSKISQQKESKSNSSIQASESSSEASSTIDIPATIPFEVPIKVTHEYAEEMFNLVNDFSSEFRFPQFDSIQNMDITSLEVATNLYIYTRQQIIDENDSTPQSYVIKAEYMENTGKRFFGQDFEFPPGLKCSDIEPDPEDPLSYNVNGRCGMGYLKYLLIDVEQTENLYTGTFILFKPIFRWNMAEEQEDNILFYYNGPNDKSESNQHLGTLIFPDEQTRENIISKDDLSYMEYCYLRIPQEQIGTIEVTFGHDQDGSLIVTSCKWNFKTV